MISSLIEKLLVKNLKGLVKRGSLIVITASGRGFHFGDASEPLVQLRFADNWGPLKLLMDPDLQLGELFMDERILVERGSVYDLLELLLRDAANTQPGFPLRKFLNSIRMNLRRLSQRNLPARAQRNVAHHY